MMSRPVDRVIYHPPADRRCGFCHGPMPGLDIYPEPVHPCCELEYRQLIEPLFRRTIRRRLAATRRGNIRAVHDPLGKH